MQIILYNQGKGRPVGKRHVVDSAPAFSPADLSPIQWLDFSDNTLLFQDAARTTPANVEDDPIGGVADKSGIGNHVSQSTDSARPLYKTNIQNGKSVARLDGSDDTFANGSKLLGTGAKTLFVVMRTTDTAGAVYGGFNQNSWVSTGTTYGQGIYTNSTIRAAYVNNSVGVNLVSEVAPSDCQIVATRFANQDSALWVNGVLYATDLINDIATSGYNEFIGKPAFGTAPLNGDICEVILYNTALSDANVAKVNQYLNNRWAAIAGP